MPNEQPLSLLLPTPETRTGGAAPAPRLTSLRGKTIGVINNQWWSFNVSLEQFEELLYERYEIGGVVTKLTEPGIPLTPEAMEDLTAKADAVINGLGN